MDLDNSGLACFIMTDTATNMVAGTAELQLMPHCEGPGGVVDANSYYMGFMAHVVNLAVKECMGKNRDKSLKLKRMMSILRCFVKKHDLFEASRK